jgi:hypothetical protein
MRLNSLGTKCWTLVAHSDAQKLEMEDATLVNISTSVRI